jgi:hypothetical protein
MSKKASDVKHQDPHQRIQQLQQQLEQEEELQQSLSNIQKQPTAESKDKEDFGSIYPSGERSTTDSSKVVSPHSSGNAD